MYRLSAVLFTVFVAVSPADAAKMTPEGVGRAAKFTQNMQKVYEEAMSLSFEMDGAEQYIEAFHAGDLGEEEFVADLDPFLESMRAAVDDFRSRFPRAPAPPAIGSKKHERSMAGFATMVVGLGGYLDRQLGVLHSLRDAALAGDDDAYDVASADSMALAGKMILAENVMLEGSLVAIGPEHPQQGLIKAIIGGNAASVVALQVIEAVFRGDEFDAASFSLGVETNLRDAERGIVSGENAARKMLKNLEGKFAETQADRYGAQFVGKLVKAYQRAFAIERAILEIERGLLDYLRAVTAGSEDPDYALDEMIDIQTDLEEQVALRMEEQNIRLEMAAEFARNMQTLKN